MPNVGMQIHLNQSQTIFTHKLPVVEKKNPEKPKRILTLRGDLLAPVEERSAGPEPRFCRSGNTIRYHT